MKKYWIISLSLLFLSVITGNLDRFTRLNDGGYIKPFPLMQDEQIHLWWYSKHIAELASFSLLMLMVCYIMKGIEQYFMEKPGESYTGIFIFVKTWHRLFWVIAITSLLDLIHYLLAFKRLEEFFLIQNGLYLMITAFFIYKAFRK